MTDALASSPSSSHDPHAPVVGLDDLLARVRLLVPVAVRRQLWTLFFDADDVQLPMLVPLDGVPELPDGPAVEHWGDALDEVAAEFGVATVVFVLERPGAARPTCSDLAWRAALVALGDARRYGVRAVVASATDGVVVLDAPGAGAASTVPGVGRRPQSSPRRLRLSEVLAVR
jgi:hypothetical protein